MGERMVPSLAADRDCDSLVNRGRKELRDKFRDLLEQAGGTGRRPPGVIALARATGVSRWRVEITLAELRGIARRPAA
ncbi:hypothetical protein [Saccharothrix sp. Mg75]|uniref:hypothetical protein n=1 Tax=Saccharothrix sp. Mg75 TaxID=3445357 RepID=UPI003EECA4F0